MKSPVTWRGVELLLMLLLLFPFAFADPSGATISGNTTETAPTVAPAVRNDSGGTITTMVLTSIQQDQFWKAYVGNVSGSLTLDNANNYTIYSWDLATTTGQVYASRFDNLTWTSVSCASQSDIVAESTFHGMTAASPDRINATFNWTIHKQFSIGSTTIAQNTCNSTVTNVNDARRIPTIASTFQEILIKDANNQFMYLADISDNSAGYDNLVYDFQMIVADSQTTTTAYYFYVELRS